MPVAACPTKVRNACLVWTTSVVAALVLGTGLGAQGAPAPRNALNLAQSEYFKVRLAAAQILARKDDARSVARLQALLQDDHPLVRRVAAMSLARRELTAGLCAPVAVLDPTASGLLPSGDPTASELPAGGLAAGHGR